MRNFILLIGGLFLSLSGWSQAFVGYGYDNYSGINGVLLNPGVLADGKYKVSVNLFSVSAMANNNAYEFDRSKLFSLHFSNLSEGNGYYKANNTDYKYITSNIDILGPSATIALDSKDAIGLVTRARLVADEFNLSNGIFQLLGTTPNPAFYNADLINRSLQTKANAFAEAGLSYGRVIKRDDHHELKIGITAKYIAGLAYASASTGQMTVNVDPANYFAKFDATVTTQYSSNLDNASGTALSDALRHQAGRGWGADIGFVYEYKSAKVGWLAFDPTPYRLRLGISVTDIGSVNYTNSTNGQTYTMTAVGQNAQELEQQNGETYSQYFARLKSEGLVTSTAGPSKINVKLPTAVHLNADYHIYKRLFINADVLVNTIANTNPISPNYVSTATITPRFEKKWLSIYVPVSYNERGQLAAGAGFRFGPVYVGSGTVLSALAKNRIQYADVHAGLTIPIFQPRNNRKRKQEEEGDDKKHHAKGDTVVKYVNVTSDRDHDGVTDDKDKCPDQPGPVELFGCPDTDGDGVPDNIDKCPTVKGSPKYNGCPIPDTDGDSVNDEEDKCPLVKGLVSNHGCPPIKPEVIQRLKRAAQKVFFVRAKDIIEPNSYGELDRIYGLLQNDSTLHLHVEGYTDSEGTPARNARLSERRANAVKNYLLKKGLPAFRMDAKGYGSSNPIASNDTPEGRAQNRRVEMHLTNY